MGSFAIALCRRRPLGSWSASKTKNAYGVFTYLSRSRFVVCADFREAIQSPCILPPASIAPDPPPVAARKNCRTAHGLTCPALWGLLVLCLAGSLPAQVSREYDLKAVFLYNFATFVEW